MPRWAKDLDAAQSNSRGIINAVGERIATTASFRASIKNRRCLILGQCFIEHMDVDGYKMKHYVKPVPNEPHAFAGIWD